MKKVSIFILFIIIFISVSLVGYKTLKINQSPSVIHSEPISAPLESSTPDPNTGEIPDRQPAFATTFEFQSDINNLFFSNVNNQAITDSLLALNLLPIQNQPFVGDEPFITFHTISPTKIRIVFKDLKNLDEDEKKDSNLIKRILLNVPNEATYFVGTLQDSNKTLEIPLYIDLASIQKLNIGSDNELSFVFFKSLYLNLQNPPLQGKIENILTTFDTKISTPNAVFKVNINNGVHLGAFKIVPEVDAQNCSGVATCGNLVENAGHCAGGSSVGQLCTNQSMCPKSSCLGITFTCGGPQYAQNCSFVGGTGPVSCTGGGACPSCALSQSCIYTPPSGGGNPPPGGGGGGNPPPSNGSCGSCSGCYAPNPDPGPNSCAMINGVCSKAGFCGGGGGSCVVNFTVPGNLTVGVPVAVHAFVPGGSQWDDGVWGFSKCTASPCSKSVSDPVLGFFVPYITGTTPYNSTFTPTVAGTSYIHFRSEGDNGGPVQCQGQILINVSSPPSSCTVDLLPNSITVSAGSSQAMVPNITTSSGSVTNVSYTSTNPAIAAASPVSTIIVPYDGQVNGISVGSTSVTTLVTMSDGKTCTDTSSVNVTQPLFNPWWQVTGGDVVTNQNLQSNVGAGNTFMLNGTGGFPGNTTYGASTTLTKANVSTKGWLGNLAYKGKTYNSTYFNNLASATVNFNSLPAVIGQSDFDTGTISSDGYYYYKASGNLTVNSKITINGNRKIVLFVLGGNLIVNNNINITNHGSGFFMAVVSGNINISPSVASASGPALEGIYEADGVIDTGSGANVLPIRGTLVGWSGVSFNRNLANNTPPAETVEYDPMLTLLFPRTLIQDNVSWQEVLP
jgi:hypothetical protein